MGSLRIDRQTTIRTWRHDFPYFLQTYLCRHVSSTSLPAGGGLDSRRSLRTLLAHASAGWCYILYSP